MVKGATGNIEIMAEYLFLGVKHILSGIDHLLFVVGMLLIVSGVWRLVKTITAFTVAHSLTLGAAALGFVHMPQAPVEAGIALSILFLASELSRQDELESGLTARRPWLVALSFGLLHGFGFAGALAEIGLPKTAIPLALFAFNLGVEAGQLLVVTVVLTALWVIGRWRINPPRWIEAAPSYVIGSAAAYWLWDRLAGFV